MKRTALALTLSVAALSAQAADLNYNNVEGSYNKTDFDGDSLDGFGIKGSLKFGDNFYGIAGYQQNDNNSLQFDESILGVGFHKALNSKTDWVSELSYVHDKVDLSGFGNGSDNGYRIATGLRGMVADGVELSGKVNYTDVGDFGNGIGVNLAAAYHFNDTWAATLGYDYSKRDNADLNGLSAGVRASF